MAGSNEINVNEWKLVLTRRLDDLGGRLDAVSIQASISVAALTRRRCIRRGGRETGRWWRWFCGGHSGDLILDLDVFIMERQDWIIHKLSSIPVRSLVLLLLWHIIHAIVNMWCFVRRVYHVLENSLIDSGYLKMYRDLNLDSLHNLAIVVDSEEAHNLLEVIQLLQWVAAIGVRNVCLYDTKGVLKKSKEIMLEKLCVPKVSEDGMTQLLEQKSMYLEFASFSDGKEAVARAANVLLAKHYLGGETAPLFTESHVAEALTTVGSGGPNPELLLVYGPARCHQGFPSWRIRYTEIIHMGPLESMNHGSLIKAMWKFSNVHQNYGK